MFLPSFLYFIFEIFY